MDQWLIWVFWHMHHFIKFICSYFIIICTDDVPTGSTDVDIQLLEAAKAGDLEVVKVGPRSLVIL